MLHELEVREELLVLVVDLPLAECRQLFAFCQAERVSAQASVEQRDTAVLIVHVRLTDFGTLGDLKILVLAEGELVVIFCGGSGRFPFPQGQITVLFVVFDGVWRIHVLDLQDRACKLLEPRKFFLTGLKFIKGLLVDLIPDAISEEEGSSTFLCNANENLGTFDTPNRLILLQVVEVDCWVPAWMHIDCFDLWV